MSETVEAKRFREKTSCKITVARQEVAVCLVLGWAQPHAVQSPKGSPESPSILLGGPVQHRLHGTYYDVFSGCLLHLLACSQVSRRFSRRGVSLSP